MATKTHEAVVRRQREGEAKQAIADLVKRGYTIIYPLTEMKRDGKTFSRVDKRHMKFVENTQTSCWICKLRRVVEVD